jgi:hypothetical protein
MNLQPQTAAKLKEKAGSLYPELEKIGQRILSQQEINE